MEGRMMGLSHFKDHALKVKIPPSVPENFGKAYYVPAYVLRWGFIDALPPRSW